jgi:hypothetical protein
MAEAIETAPADPIDRYRFFDRQGCRNPNI